MFGSSGGVTPQEEFRGAQEDLVRRGSGFLSIVGALGALALMPFFPPTAEIGAAGWALTLPLAVVSLALGVARFTLRVRPSFAEIRTASFVGIVQIALLQWLAGGGRAPYLQLLLLPALGTAMSQSVRCCAAMLAFVAAAALSPLLYSTIDPGQTATELSMLSVMTLMLAVVISSTRSHRAHLKDAREHADTLAHVDVLTGLSNRRAFDEMLERALDDGDEGRRLALLLCDVNSFKQINDSFGHGAGDDALRSIAQTLSGEVRAPDAAFRWAGDEFAVILLDGDRETAARVAGRLHEAVKRSCRRPDGRPISIGTGVAELRPGMSSDDLLAEADRALLSEKQQRSRLAGVA
jgi:diguanylate cyclase (GGDEF)-like protein